MGVSGKALLGLPVVENITQQHGVVVAYWDGSYYICPGYSDMAEAIAAKADRVQLKREDFKLAKVYQA